MPENLYPQLPTVPPISQESFNIEMVRKYYQDIANLKEQYTEKQRKYKNAYNRLLHASAGASSVALVSGISTVRTSDLIDDEDLDASMNILNKSIREQEELREKLSRAEWTSMNKDQRTKLELGFSISASLAIVSTVSTCVGACLLLASKKYKKKLLKCYELLDKITTSLSTFETLISLSIDDDSVLMPKNFINYRHCTFS